MISEESRKSNLSIEKQDDGDIRCPNCSWYFSSNTKPYILPCFHNLCDKCINILIQQKNPKCPICSTTFTNSESNPFQVNFAYLNLVTKILANKIIFCIKCNKIFYWIDHYTICNQENFIEAEEIYKDIKNSCDQSIRILKLFNGNNNIIIKYKNEIMSLLGGLLQKIRKKNVNNIKKGIGKLFIINDKEKLKLNYEEIKKNIINFIIISTNQYEYFNKNDLLKENNSLTLPKSSNESLNMKNENKLFNKNNNINKSQRNNNSTNISLTNDRNKNKILKLEEKYNYQSTCDINNKDQIQKTPENESKNNNAINKENSTKKDLTKSNNIIDNKYNKQIEKIEKIENKNKSDSEDELIDNFDDDYHDNENNETELAKKNIDRKNFSDLHYIPPDKLKEIKDKTYQKIKNKDLFEKSLLQDTKTEKKLIIGLNEIKVISLKKKIGTNLNKSNSEDIIIKKNNNNKIKINKNNNKNNINDMNIKQSISKLIFKKEKENDKNNITNKNFLFKNKNNKIFSGIGGITTKKNTNPNINLFISSDFTKSSDKIFNIENKKIIKCISPKINQNSNINRCCISLNNILKLKSTNDKKYIQLFSSNKNKINNLLFINQKNKKIVKKKPFINISNINNINKEYFTNRNKSIFINNLTNTNNKSMNNIFTNFNNIKDIINKINKYIQITKYINNSINNNINQHISLLKHNISQDYNMLLDDVVNNFFYTQRKFLFSFKNNTKFIILFDIEYNNFIPLDLSDILKNYPNFNPSMQFEFIENNDKYLLFITGGNPIIIKDNENYSSDSFSIINIELNINLSFKNKINYKKKYIIEYEDKMPSNKSYHSILYFNNNLYIIGGFNNNKKASNECFYFSYDNKKWEMLPHLNIPRANGSICIYNKSILYLFRGRNNEGSLNTIEYLNINEKKNWEIINVIDYGYIWNNIYNSCVVVLKENKILIFGGEDENKLYKESILFDIKNKNVYRGMDMKIPAAFNGMGIFNKGKIYGFDFKNKNGDYEHKMHIFDIKYNYWSINYYNSKENIDNNNN